MLLLRVDEFLDDPAHRRELVEIRARRLIGRTDRDGLQRFAQGVAAARLGESEHRIPFSGEAFVQLDDGTANRRALLAQRDERGDQIGFAFQIFGTGREIDAGLTEDLPASRLGAQVRELRVEAVEGHAEQDRQLALEGRRVEDGHVGA